MSNLFRVNSPLGVLKHLILIVLIVALMLFIFFFVYLPATTNHGQTITVPKITGMRLDQLEDYLADNNLRYFVNDSSYSTSKKPFEVLTQDPVPGSKVKEDRKIYISYNMKTPPQIKMPKLTGLAVKNVQTILKSYDLQVGEVRFVPDLEQNAVLKQLYQGKEIAPGALITKGAVIDLVVGNGLGNDEFEVPRVVGMPVDEATVLLVGQNLQVGSIIYQAATNGEADGTVLRQRPNAGSEARIRVGEMVDLWVAGPEPVQPVE
ncbi:PASTA domain-containing protein [Adhaeribacter pallidiroseus]|uniref:Non-specific serine/threonine protein kinase n=1 Tax=Adhaeribacter pallidiroseus TaxID=2072847 RepID=A0A369QKL0_9BACT|nr:PASTA domain-containing protein [Adhaeribacter pallidiroseus]RDC63756.1 Non-specific serine/threonine protein kinase [Adhaeribacter pallidiroseus]